jgi:hypothetical protein
METLQSYDRVFNSEEHRELRDRVRAERWAALLTALRDRTYSNREFGRLRDHQFGVDAQHAAQVMGVARLYCERPDIYRAGHVEHALCIVVAIVARAKRQAFERRAVARVGPSEVRAACGKLRAGRPKARMAA